MAIESSYEEILQKLIDQTKIFGASINTIDGLPVISVFKNKDVEEALISALSSTFINHSEEVINIFEFGKLNNARVEGEDGQIYLYKINPSLILLILAPKSISQGILHLGIKNSIRSFQKLKL
ncbi:MAG: hypothetical protein EU549_01845 [Promethearchaeota archaeon]|nr:MAG: hypothetical protein EU549_01845 [Candidatus Lokiarchaeota archaeon]